MDILEPEQLEIVSISNYEHILYLAADGRAFLTLTHESGLMPYSETVLLTSEEKIKIESNAESYIEKLRGSFSHESKTFSFHNGKRAVSDFDSWIATKTALEQLHRKN